MNASNVAIYATFEAEYEAWTLCTMRHQAFSMRDDSCGTPAVRPPTGLTQAFFLACVHRLLMNGLAMPWSQYAVSQHACRPLPCPHLPGSAGARAHRDALRCCYVGGPALAGASVAGQDAVDDGLSPAGAAHRGLVLRLQQEEQRSVGQIRLPGHEAARGFQEQGAPLYFPRVTRRPHRQHRQHGGVRFWGFGGSVLQAQVLVGLLVRRLELGRFVFPRSLD